MFDLTSTDAWLDGARIIGVLAIAYIALMWIAMVVWTYRDIASRTRDGTTQAISVLLVAAFFVPGLLLYLALRPQENMSDAYNRQLEAEAFASEIGRAQACPDCRRAVSEDFVVCPYCRSQLRIGCEDCGRSLANDWTACPFCGTGRGLRSYAPQTRAAAVAAPRVVAPQPRAVQAQS